MFHGCLPMKAELNATSMPIRQARFFVLLLRRLNPPCNALNAICGLNRRRNRELDTELLLLSRAVLYPGLRLNLL
jgi:hypothetical protein